jgi:hypothetical protein
MNTLEKDLTSAYLPVFQKQCAKLYLARKWHQRSLEKERDLLGYPCVEGLVFSSFRHDNPGPIRRNDWTVKYPSSDTDNAF